MSLAFDVKDFDENWYTTFYSDVAAAIERREISSGLEHYLKFGEREGRSVCDRQHWSDDFDEAWYAQAYPMARIEVEAAIVESFAKHYQTLGRARGYLPNRRARRPADPTAAASRFGGCWPDRADAKDLIRGKLDIGHITSDEAEQLTHWVDHGYVIIQGALSAELLERAEAALDAAYRGELDDALFHGADVSPESFRWNEKVQTHLVRALDLHWLSADLRAASFAPAICRFLEIVFERRCLASQTLTYRQGSGQSYHMDTFYVPFSSPMQFAASWVALEDVAQGAGELSYFSGSHRLPERLFRDEFKGMHELQRVRGGDPSQAIREYEVQLPQLAKQYGFEERRFLAKRGDVLIWHAGLAHGGTPVTDARTRKSLVTHYCPANIAPLYWEWRSALMRSFDDRAYYSTVCYEDVQHR